MTKPDPQSWWKTIGASLAGGKSKLTANNDRGVYELVERDANRPINLEDSEEDSVTDDDLLRLRFVSDALPRSAFLVAAVEFCERFSYYALTGPFQNYISNSRNDPNGLPGALGLGQSTATALTNFFHFWCYLTPLLGAVVADQFLGKYRTIRNFSIVYMVGILILFLTSLPFAIDNGLALGGLIVAMIVIGLGTGGIKSNVSPLIAEQYRSTKPYIKTLSSGERVIVDPATTIQRIYMIFYLCINVGGLSSIVSTLIEKNIGFWLAFLLPLFTFIVGFCILVAGEGYYVVRPPTGSILTSTAKVLWIGASNKGNLDAAKPDYAGKRLHSHRITWDSDFVDELKKILSVCKVFLFYPVYWVAYLQMVSSFFLASRFLLVPDNHK